MIEGVSASLLAAAGGAAQQANLIAMKTAIQSEQTVANMLNQLVQAVPAANPDGVGGSVDTYA